jgi:hypothetical protein
VPNPNVVLGATNVIRPGAYSQIDASELVPSSLGLGNVIAILGDATGGAPGTPLFFRSGEAAKDTFRSGDLLDGIRFAYDPANDPNVAGADVVCGIRLNPATRSTLALLGASGTLVTLTSVDYGAWTVGIQVKVEAGTTTGKKITIQYIDATEGTILEVFDNLATGPAAVAAINTGISPSTPASRFVTAVSGGGTESLVNIAFTALAGGAEGTTTSTHWTNALAALENEEVDLIVALTNDPTITALVKGHVEAQSSVKNRKERLAFVGAAPAVGFGTTALFVADCVSKAQTLGSSRVVLVAPGVKRPNLSGVTTLYPAQFTGAALAGIAAAQQIGQTPTAKLVKALAIEAQFNGDQLETLLLGGVCPVVFRKDQGFRCEQCITTYQTDANPLFREFSVRRVGDFVMKNLRLRLEREFVGARGDQGTVNAMLESVKSLLNQFVSERVIVNYRSVTINLTGGTARVSFEFAPTEPINYVLIEGHAKPASLAVSFSGQASFSGANP